TSVTVNNVPPSLDNVSITPSVNEGDQATLSGNIIDPGSLDTFMLGIDWGDGSPLQMVNYAAAGSTSTPFSVTHTYVKTGRLPVTLTVTDKDGGQGTASTSVTVSNVAPTLGNVSITPSVNQGGVATLSGTISDPGTSDTFTALVNWGDGSAPQTFHYAANGLTTTPFSVTHMYSKAGTLPVSLTVTDQDNDQDTASTSILVKNVAPMLSNVPMPPPTINGGGQATLSGNIADPGLQDSFTLVVNWGDGSAPQTFAYAAGTTSFSQAHQFLQAGNLTV